MMKNFKPVLVLFLALACIALAIPAAADAYYAKMVYSRFSCTAGETLATGDVVMIKDSDGKCYKADADASTLRPAVGIIGKGGASAASVEVITAGIFSGWTSLAEGGAGYLSTTAGAVTQTAYNAYSQKIATAINTTDYQVSFEPAADVTALYTAPTVSTTFTAADCGKTIGVATDALTHALPATIAGCKLCFRNQGAAGNNIMTLSPAAVDKIWGTCISAAGVGTIITGADDEDLINTKATAKKGDEVCLEGDGVDGYAIVSGCTGTFAEATP